MKGAKLVTDLDEGLDLAALGQLLRTHTLRYLEGVTLDAGNDSMGVGALLGALVELLDDDDLVSCLAALEDDRNLYAYQLQLTSHPRPYLVCAIRTLPGL